jgi:hypothetical protein
MEKKHYDKIIGYEYSTQSMMFTFESFEQAKSFAIQELKRLKDTLDEQIDEIESVTEPPLTRDYSAHIQPIMKQFYRPLSDVRENFPR